ncbi:hypothetical protein ACIGFJ_12675 [Brevundimonas diminuta]|uniref:hypothetical protein n=1 Tax=Brevundimonas diminuta TaxID=293 RepID=UPI0037CAEFE8
MSGGVEALEQGEMLVGPAPISERFKRGVGNVRFPRQGSQALSLGCFAHVQDSVVDRIHADMITMFRVYVKQDYETSLFSFAA